MEGQTVLGFWRSLLGGLAISGRGLQVFLPGTLALEGHDLASIRRTAGYSAKSSGIKRCELVQGDARRGTDDGVMVSVMVPALLIVLELSKYRPRRDCRGSCSRAKLSSQGV
jgi:hypothetical protein